VKVEEPGRHFVVVEARRKYLPAKKKKEGSTSVVIY
jgi:hypothetical protein